MSRQSYLLPNGRVLRYTYRERMTHWLVAASYIYLLLTGLAFWSPWLYWLAIVLGGATISREIHPWVGLVFVFGVWVMHSMWGRQMKETADDKKWWEAIGHYIRNEDDQVPSAGRFNAGQKLLFWGFFYNAILLLLTGLVLWLPQHIPWDLHYLRDVCVIVHPICALLTIGLFIIHVYMGTAMERGAFGSVIRGDVSRAWAEHYHNEWLQELQRDSDTTK
jgi:formate dehydrogenase subunit gamma